MRRMWQTNARPRHLQTIVLAVYGQNGDISQNSDRSKISVKASSVNLKNRGFMFEYCITIPTNTDIRTDSHIGICYCSVT